MKLRILILALALGTSAGAQARDATSAWDSVAFEMNSWGQPLASWTVFRGGGGNWVETVREGNTTFGKYTLVVHQVEAGDRGYGALLGILRNLPRQAPDYEACRNSMTDMPYGTLRLTRGSTTTEIAWNAGCMDKPYVEFLDTLKSANELVGGWGKSGKVLRSEMHGQ
jgi:hypothetical protein